MDSAKPIPGFLEPRIVYQYWPKKAEQYYTLYQYRFVKTQLYQYLPILILTDTYRYLPILTHTY